MQRTALVSIVVGCLVSTAKPALTKPVNEAGRAYASGKAMLLKADFDGALEAFKAAAKAAMENQEYGQQYAMLRQVTRMRRDLPKEQDAERWLKMARALRTFYYDNGLYSEALPLDRKRNRRHQSTESAVLLAETQLALGMYSQAVEMLRALPKKQNSPRTRVLHGLALTHMGNTKEAKRTAKVPWLLKDDLGPRYFYDLARLRALSGDSKKACKALTRSFELTPPSQLGSFKAKVRECDDFNTLQSTAGFVKALKTTSKIKESSCSKGTGCGKCPQRAKCGTKSAKDDKNGP
jgi:tetratricopeptide (TPR) repeat protein